MGVVNTTGVNSSLLDGFPPVRVDTAGLRSRKRIVIDFATVQTTDTATSTYRLGRIYSSDIVTSMKLFNVAQAGFTSASIGLSQTLANGSALLSVACYANAISLAAASNTGTEVAFAVKTFDKSLQKVWQDAGATLDPLRFFDVTLTANTIAAVGGLIMIQTEVSID